MVDTSMKLCACVKFTSADQSEDVRGKSNNTTKNAKSETP